MPVIQNFSAFMTYGLICPEGKKRIEYSVGEEPGLFVECRATAKSTPMWYLRLKNAKGTNIYKRIGTIKEVSLSQAKKMAQRLRAEHQAALKSGADQVSPATPLTLKVFMEKHYMPYAVLHKRSAKKDEIMFRLHSGPQFGHQLLNQISKREVQAFHSDLLKKGQSPASADHNIKLLRRALNLAVKWEFLEKNPLTGIELFNEDNRVDNHLDDAAVDRLVKVLQSDSNRTVSLILQFLLSCGARKSSVLHAKWSEIDLANRVWKIPAVNSKSKRTATVPLNDSAVYILEQLDTKGRSEYLFVNKETGKPYTSISNVWYRIRKAAGLTSNVRIHDLRHTFASMLVSSGNSLYAVQQILGHSDPKVTMRYAHLSAKTLREAANAASVIVPRSQPTAA